MSGVDCIGFYDVSFKDDRVLISLSDYTACKREKERERERDCEHTSTGLSLHGVQTNGISIPPRFIL